MFKIKEKLIGGISVYILELPIYIAESYKLLSSHAKFIEKKRNKMNSLVSHDRKEYFSKLSEAFNQNFNNIELVLSLLKEHVSLSSYEAINIPPSHEASNLTLKDFVYLRRDWSFSQESEEQLKLVKDFILFEMSQIDFERGSSLFLGCGVGRIALEFLGEYETVYATDKSYSMIWHLNHLLQGNTITFYNPKLTNIQKIDNSAQKYSVNIPQNILEKLSSENFKSFVADVLDLPFKKKCLNAVYSVYFSDVIALKLWFSQIDSVLIEGGLFIHFGPLDYFFTDEREMLTAEEFRDYFEQRSYTTLVDNTLETSHLKDTNSNSYKIYRNWLFVAQKNKKIELTDNSVLRIQKPLEFQKTGIIQNGIVEKEVVLKLPNGDFEGADSVISILGLIDGKKTVLDIIEELKRMGYEFDSSEIKDLLSNFLLSKVLVFDEKP